MTLQKNPQLTIDQQIIGDIYTATEAMDNLTILCDDFGSRFGGTPGERQAADFIKAKLEAYGLSNVHLEPVEYQGWQRRTATLEIVEPVQKTIPCISLPQSPPAEIEANLIDLGDGNPQDFTTRADEIAGNVVIATSVIVPPGVDRWVHRSEKYGRSVLAGAAGFIFMNHYPGYGPATGGVGHKGQAGLIPGISVSCEDGAYLLRLLKKAGRVKIKLTTTDVLQPMTAWNVLGDLPGAKDPAQVVMLGSHFDGHDISQGAEDPASGTVAVLEAARVLAKYAPNLPYTLRFAFWDIEEIGLLGSTAYVNAHRNELDNIRFYLNLDSAGAIKDKGLALNKWPQLYAYFESMSEEMAYPFLVEQSMHAHSDHYPFFMAGVPTGAMQQIPSAFAGRGYGHTKFDTLDKVSITHLREASMLAARWALRLAADEAWPVSRRPHIEIEQILAAPDYQAELEYESRLDELYARR